MGSVARRRHWTGMDDGGLAPDGNRFLARSSKPPPPGTSRGGDRFRPSILGQLHRIRAGWHHLASPADCHARDPFLVLPMVAAARRRIEAAHLGTAVAPGLSLRGR